MQSIHPVSSAADSHKDLRKTTTEIETAYFDRLVTEEGDFNPFKDRGWQTISQRFAQWIAPTKKLEMLDIGCGTGQSLQIYAPYIGRYIGIDLSETALEAARKKYPQWEWQNADACALPFADNLFDVVAFSSVLHHIPDYSLALKESYRVLKPGGCAFAFDPNVLHPAMAILRHPKSPFYLAQGVSPNERPLLPKSLRTAFTQSGFVHLRQRGQSDIPYRAVAPRRINSILSVYNFGDYLWEHSGLGRIFGVFVLTCGQKPTE